MDRDFTGNWALSGTAVIEGSAGNDDETIKLYTGDSAASEIWYVGIGIYQIFRDKYRSGQGDLVLEYRTGIDVATVEGSGWSNYDGINFDCDGYVQVRISRT